MNDRQITVRLLSTKRLGLLKFAPVWLLIQATVVIGCSMVLGRQEAIAQTPPTTLPFALVSTLADAEVRTTPSYRPRFGDAVGDGTLILNADGNVTGYYFIVSDLSPDAKYAYHFHRDIGNGAPTSCEGDKSLVDDETPGGVMLDLGAIAPLNPTASGLAFVGSPTAPVTLPTPVPLSEIGYLNIHAVVDGAVSPGVVCANIRLNAGGLPR
jgi:hypothetical protein